MGVKVRRYVVVAGIGLLLVPATVSAATSSNKVNAAAAARSCSQGQPLKLKIRSIQVPYLARFVPCVLRAARTQLRLGYNQSPAASRLVLGALGRLIGLPYNRTHQLKLALKATRAASSHVSGTTCLLRGSRRSTESDVWVGIPSRPGITPLLLSKILVQAFANPRSVINDPQAVFAVAVRRGLLMESGAMNGTVLGVVYFVCH
jgi:stage V sporulation protein SpoVS